MSNTPELLANKTASEDAESPYSYRVIIDEVKKTYDSLAEVYDYFYPPLEFKKSRFIQTLHRFLQNLKVKRILDCACGTGREIIPLAKTGCYDLVVGSDLSEKMLEKAIQKAEGLKIQWVKSDWMELPQKINYRDFDAVLCLGNPLAHIPPKYYRDIFLSFNLLLRNGGALLINRRNCEAELCVNKFSYRKPENTIFNPIPKLSFLNSFLCNGNEICAYFSYHHYNEKERIQILHLIEISKNGVLKDNKFVFHCFNEIGPLITEGMRSVNFINVQEFQIQNNDTDEYTEEFFIEGHKNG